MSNIQKASFFNLTTPLTTCVQKHILGLLLFIYLAFWFASCICLYFGGLEHGLSNLSYQSFNKRCV